MQYVCIVLITLVLLLAVRLYFLHLALRSASEDMEEIEAAPEQNRQLKSRSTNHELERLLGRINLLYTERQKERIVYQRREQQIRQEIENISHDLRTPLTSILGYLDLIEDDDTSTAEREEYLGIIRRRAKILQGFIQDFYEISRIEADDYPLKLSSIPVQSILKEAVVAYYLDFEKRGIEVTISLEDKPCCIIADRVQFERIINNLLQNALKYADQQFIIRQTSTKDSCTLQFINDSTSITEEELSRIFERFYTVDQSRNSQSTGLGLTITKILTEKMKGLIETKIENNQFIIELSWPMQQNNHL
jgi:signal transduction histidine kinase